jgi:hypothetical protein
MIGDPDAAANGAYEVLKDVSAVTTPIGGAAKIYKESVAQGVALPAVLINSFPYPDDQKTSSGEVVLSTPYFEIFAACEGRARFNYLNPIAAAIYTALHNKGFLVGSNRVDFVKMKDIRRSRFVNGKHYTHRGGLYMAVVQ